MWSEAYNDWLAGDEPAPENYSQDDWEKFQEMLNYEEQLDY